jgi:hypothetical protein
MITVDLYLRIANEEDSYDTRSVNSFDGPKPPAVLRHFSSALQTCKYFRDTIANRVRIDNAIDGLYLKNDWAAPISLLQTLQSSRIWGNLRKFLNMGLGAVDGNLDILVQIAGVFWKNPVLHKDFDVLDELFFVLGRDDLTNLIPYLGEWISLSAVEKKRHKKYVGVRVYDDSNDEEFYVKLQCGPRAAMDGEVVNIYSIVGVCPPELTSNEIIDGDNEAITEIEGPSRDVGERESIGSQDAGPRLVQMANEQAESLEAEDDDKSPDELEPEPEAANEDEIEDEIEDVSEEQNEDEPRSYWSDEELQDGQEYDHDRISELRMVRDIREATSGTWWLIREQGSKVDWFIVRYYRDEDLGRPACKVYVGHDGGSVAEHWDPLSWHHIWWPVGELLSRYSRTGYLEPI